MCILFNFYHLILMFKSLLNCPLFGKIYWRVLACQYLEQRIYPLIIKVFKKKKKKTFIQDADYFVFAYRVWNWNGVWKSDHRICQESIIEEQSIYLCCLRFCIVRGYGSLLFPFGSWYFVCFLGIVRDLTRRVW